VPDYFLIAGGYVYDPANGIDGQVKDLWVADGKIAEPPSDPAIRPTRTLNAAGLVVMPGGIDMHCHIAGPKVNAARKMRGGPVCSQTGLAGGIPTTLPRKSHASFSNPRVLPDTLARPVGSDRSWVGYLRQRTA
jgi:formylmethanofuran dehydrogenase subunit A